MRDWTVACATRIRIHGSSLVMHAVGRLIAAGLCNIVYYDSDDST
jgi:hypothetical protein